MHSILLAVLLAVHPPLRSTPPLGRVWYADEYEDWNHAIAEIVEYAGDPKKYPMPLGDGRWLIVWETVGNDVYYPPGAWHIESFDSSLDAATRYESLPPSTKKRLLTEPSGKILVIYKQQQ